MNRIRRAIVAVAVSAMALSGVGLAGGSATAATGPICEQYGSTAQGGYIVMNNRWNPAATGQQCIDVTDNGFRIARQPNSVTTNGGPAGYPAIYSGCHYTNCSSDGLFPRRLNTIGSIDSSIGWTFVSGGSYNASYDIWLDPTAKRDGVNRTEIMIWFNRVGPIQPVGSDTGQTVRLAGRDWRVWQGNNGQNDVVSYVAPTAIPSMSFDTMDFVRDTVARGVATDSWYLTSIQAGFEPWSGGEGLAVRSFSVGVDGGSPTTPPTVPPTTPPTGQGCTASYRVVDTWSGGFTAEVKVTNTRSSAVPRWTVGWRFAGGQTVRDSWSTRLTSSGSTYTARPVDYNSTIAAGGSTTFGFVGAGAPGSAPALTCSAG